MSADAASGTTDPRFDQAGQMLTLLLGGGYTRPMHVRSVQRHGESVTALLEREWVQTGKRAIAQIEFSATADRFDRLNRWEFSLHDGQDPPVMALDVRLLMAEIGDAPIDLTAQLLVSQLKLLATLLRLTVLQYVYRLP